MTWLRAHKWLALVVALALVWIVYRVIRGLSITGAGHASPEDAIAEGWMVYPAGITGWFETSPDGSQSIMHDTGWNGDPFGKAG
jgi:hypothetical protein